MVLDHLPLLRDAVVRSQGHRVAAAAWRALWTASWPRVAWILAAGFLTSTPVSAQLRVAGRVIDSLSGVAVASVEVRVGEVRVLSGVDGGFALALDGFGGRVRVLTASRTGYRPLTLRLSFVAFDSTYVELRLLRQVQTVQGVQVVAEGGSRNAKLHAFERRKALGTGRFLMEADLVHDQSRPLADVVRRLPGALIARDKGAAYLASSRGTATLEAQPAMRLPDSRPLRRGLCPMSVLLDGVPVYRGVGPKNASAPDPEPPFDINQIATRDILAMEFYAGPAQVPAELNSTGTGCGMLLIWTK